jgi:iron(III) transport system substrate-binding protein
MKPTIYCFLFFSIAALLSCGNDNASGQQAEMAAASPDSDPKRISLMTYRHYPQDDSIFSRLKVNQGYTVDMMEMSGRAILDSLAASVRTDVVIFPDLTYAPEALSQQLLQYHGLPGLDSYYKSALRDHDGFWTGLTRRYPVIGYEKEGPEPAQLGSFQDLANARWKGKVLLPPATDAALLTVVTSIYVQQGEDAARDWAERVLSNGSGRTAPEQDRLLAVAAGPEELTISMLDDFAYLRQPATHKEYEMSESLAIVMPKDQDGESYYTLSFAAMPVQSNPLKAKVLIEYLCSQYAQDKYASAAFELPANVMTLPAEPLLDYLGGVKDDDMSMEVMVQYLPVVRDMLQEIGWP